MKKTDLENQIFDQIKYNPLVDVSQTVENTLRNTVQDRISYNTYLDLRCAFNVNYSKIGIYDLIIENMVFIDTHMHDMI